MLANFQFCDLILLIQDKTFYRNETNYSCVSKIILFFLLNLIMSGVDDRVMCEMHLLRRNAHKAVEKALVKRKSDKALLENEMEELRGEVEPLMSQLDDCVSKHVEMLEGEESNEDEEIEGGKCRQSSCTLWQHCLELWRLQETPVPSLRLATCFRTRRASCLARYRTS